MLYFLLENIFLYNNLINICLQTRNTIIIINIYNYYFIYKIIINLIIIVYYTNFFRSRTSIAINPKSKIEIITFSTYPVIWPSAKWCFFTCPIRSTFVIIFIIFHFLIKFIINIIRNIKIIFIINIIIW